MKKSILFFIAILLFSSSPLLAQCDIELSIVGESINGNSLSFSIVMSSNIGAIRLADSDFTVVDADGQSNFTGGVSSDGLPGTSPAGGGTSYIVNYSIPVAFASPTSNVTIATVTVSGFTGGVVQLQWGSAIVNRFNDSDNQVPLTTCLVNASNQALPVELSYFTAKNTEERTIQLNWETESELNNSGFEVQHSIDGNNWEYLGFVEGQGTTVETQNYQFTHKQADWGDNYYRLMQMDYDGASEYSDIEIVSIESIVKEFILYPNPTVDQVNIYVNKDEVAGELAVIDQHGRIVMIKVMDEYTDRHTLQLNHLPKGIYYIKMKVGKRVYSKQVILQE